MTESALDTLAGLRDSVGRWGEQASPLQWADARSLLGDGPRLQWWGRPRGFSKTRDASGLLLAALLTGQVPVDHPAYCVASDIDQAGLVLASIRSFVAGTALGSRLTIRASTVTDRETGGQIIVLPADAAGALGLRPSWALIDECANWNDTSGAETFFENLSSGRAKTRGRLLVITTAGLVGHWSQKIYEQAKSDSAWRVSETHDVPPWMLAEDVEIERRRLPPSAFARFWQNLWSSGDDRLSDAAAIDRCVGHSGPLTPASGRSYVMAVDLGVKRDPTVGVVVHHETRGNADVVVVDRLQRWMPSPGAPVDLEDVAGWIREMNRSYRPARVDIESWQAFQMLGELRSSGVPVREFVASSPSSSKVALALFDRIQSGGLDLPDDPVLIAELKTVRLVAAGGAAERYRLDHVSGQHNDQSVALGIAILALMERRNYDIPGLGAGIEAAMQGLDKQDPWPTPSSAWDIGGHADDGQMYPGSVAMAEPRHYGQRRIEGGVTWNI